MSGRQRGKQQEEEDFLADFKPYYAKRNTLPAGPSNSIGIQKNGMISISSDLADHLGDEQNPGWVILRFNSKTHWVAIMRTREGVGGSYRVSKPKGQRSYVNGGKFLAYIAEALEEQGIRMKDEHIFLTAEWREDGDKGAILFELPVEKTNYTRLSILSLSASI